MATDTPVLYGLRCTDTDPIGHRAGKVYAEGASWEVIARLAVANLCYELVTSADGGQTWWPVAGPEDPKLIHGVAGFGPCPGCGERCPVVNEQGEINKLRAEVERLTAGEDSRVVLAEAEIKRLRARVHEVADEANRRGAEAESQLARLRGFMAEARRRHNEEMSQLGEHPHTRISGYGHAAAASILAELAAVEAERDRYREHSITLNTVAFAIADALGDVPPGTDRIEGNPVEQAQRLIAKADKLSDELAAATSEIEQLRPLAEAAHALHEALAKADHVGVQVHDMAVWREMEQLCSAVHDAAVEKIYPSEDYR